MSDIYDEMNLWQILAEIRRHTKQENYNSEILVDIEKSFPGEQIWFWDLTYEQFWVVPDEEIHNLDLEMRKLFENETELVVDFLNWRREIPMLQEKIEKWENLRGFW